MGCSKTALRARPGGASVLCCGLEDTCHLTTWQLPQGEALGCQWGTPSSAKMFQAARVQSSPALRCPEKGAVRGPKRRGTGAGTKQGPGKEGGGKEEEEAWTEAFLGEAQDQLPALVPSTSSALESRDREGVMGRVGWGWEELFKVLRTPGGSRARCT